MIRSESLPSFLLVRIKYGRLLKERKEELHLEEVISLLFDFQSFEENEDLQSVIDAVHSRYESRQLNDDEAELVAAAGRPEAAFKHKDPKDLYS